MSNIFGSALGEFGSAFDTLEVAVKYTPAYITYGYGTSYLAGVDFDYSLGCQTNSIFLDKGNYFCSSLPVECTLLWEALFGRIILQFFMAWTHWQCYHRKIHGKLNLGIVLSKQHNALYGRGVQLSRQR